MANFAVLPPEINSLLMFSGVGSAPMLDAAAAWQGLAAELGSASSSFWALTSGVAGQAWQGPASAAMAASARSYVGFLSAAAAQAQEAAGGARAVAGAFETARAAIVHPLAVAANRSAIVQLVRSNFLGLNAVAIMAAEGEYEQMWATDVSAMTGYHAGASAAAAQLLPAQNALRDFLHSLPNLGIGNKGNANLGNGNTGNSNLGSGNTGSGNLPIPWFRANSTIWASATRVRRTSASGTRAS
ncbi:putative PPE family protein PPE42 [Mycobacterium marinum]|nr:putative PPE family protein PPE42 [Mycobacterium marinum]EPQ75015.1 PPE family protein [Mycobacterium marinum str. Europe]CDM77629.1 PPE-repeat proteins [Mycobacterium marinum E11]RFZ10782.1 putative PPE family protein PPE42 [Mycobacterium marinum]RFZ42925.1 putative PPE family protein PPE42 [Mycobacterium marinum]